MKEKLNWLQRHLPEGLLADAAWLESHGYSPALRSKYVLHGWLERLVHGVYRRKPASLSGEGTDLRWQQVVISLQAIRKFPVLVGGRTSLDLQGYAHYLAPGGPREIHLYCAEPLPVWVSKLKFDAEFRFHNAARLFEDGKLPEAIDGLSAEEGGTEHLDPLATASLARQTWGQSDWPLVLSSPERAILELLDELPDRETFHQADMLMDGLAALRPRRLSVLLAACRSVKVKRLFFWFAERHNHAWLKSIDRTGIDLGSGKRMLVRGGKLDTKYGITVPENLDAGG